MFAKTGSLLKTEYYLCNFISLIESSLQQKVHY